MSRAEFNCVIVSLVAIATRVRDVVTEAVNECYIYSAKLDNGHAVDNEGSYLEGECRVTLFRLIISKVVEVAQTAKRR